jgi:hypothetical protein
MKKSIPIESESGDDIDSDDDISKLDSIKMDSNKSSQKEEDSKSNKISIKTKSTKNDKKSKNNKESKNNESKSKKVKNSKNTDKESKNNDKESKNTGKNSINNDKSSKNIQDAKEEKPQEILNKEQREKEISDLAKMLLKKNFEGRRFVEEKIKKWSQSVLDEMWNYLTEKYPRYGFGILLFLTEELDFYTAGQAIFNRELDSKIVEVYKNQSMSAVIVIFFVKKRKRDIEILYIDPEHFFNINRIFGNALEKREWNNKFEKYLVNAANDINTYIIKDYTLGKSFLQGFALKNDYIKIHGNFKFGNLEFLPYITSYSNDDIVAYLFIFFLNN